MHRVFAARDAEVGVCCGAVARQRPPRRAVREARRHTAPALFLTHATVSLAGPQGAQPLYWGATEDGQLLLGSHLDELEGCSPTATQFPAGACAPRTVRRTPMRSPGALCASVCRCVHVCSTPTRRVSDTPPPPLNVVFSQARCLRARGTRSRSTLATRAGCSWTTRTGAGRHALRRVVRAVSRQGAGMCTHDTTHSPPGWLCPDTTPHTPRRPGQLLSFMLEVDGQHWRSIKVCCGERH
jgi:hypothetical protein